MATVFTDLSGATPATNPDELIKVYVGYTDDELRRGSPAVLVK